ncbi:MAG: succinylglutamate desuccinylase/aspartoacylase family protein, partial [Phycisphaerales bacterium]|nr:succinylglutamate desuccinylase/aspartoacylase family protein [Phycisphaerales bacterium]
MAFTCEHGDSFESRRAFHAPLIVLLMLLLASASLAHTTTGLLAEGTEWENPYFIIDSGEPGPTLLVTGGIHGNEPAGYRAAEQVRYWPIARGRLIVIPRVNTPGLTANTRWLPAYADDESLRDANRNFPKLGEPDEAVTIPCDALWRFVKEQQPDWVVDLHEGCDFHTSNPESVGSSLIYMNTPRMQHLAALIHDDVSETVTDPARAFVKLSRSGPVQGGIVRSAIDMLGAKGFIFETTFIDQPVSTRTRQHRVMVHRLMRELDMTAGDRNVMTGPADRDVIRVAVFDGGGVGHGAADAFARIVDAHPNMRMHYVGEDDIRAGVLNQFDVVIFPGGSGSRQARSLGEDGRTAVCEFVTSGGGYVGVCAGAYLAAANFDWSLDLIDGKTLTGKREIPGKGRKSMWYRGESAVVRMQLTEAGKAILGERDGLLDVRYNNGPILSPAEEPDLPDYTVLAYFRSEVFLYDVQKGTMIDTAAIVAGPCGAGRAISISPHPESTESLHRIVIRAIEWVAAPHAAPLRVGGMNPMLPH